MCIETNTAQGRGTSVASRVSRAALQATLLAFTAACAGDSPTASGVPTVPVVPPVAVATVDVQPAEYLLEVGESVTLHALPKSATGTVLTDRAVNWASSDDAIVVVSPAGVATARAEGVTFATATSEAKTGSVRIIVRAGGPPAPAPVIAALSPAQITAGWPGPFTLTITGENFTARSQIRWANTPRETNFISATELRTIVNPSDVAMPAEIEVSVETPAPGGGSARRTFPIKLRAVSQVDVTTTVGQWLWIADTMSLTAVARDPVGNVIPHWTFDWSSTNEGIASVNANGLVTGLANGTAEIRATAGGVTGGRSLSVYEAPAFDLVYDVGASGQRRIMLWRPASPSSPTALTASGDSYDPSPSPDGRRVAFTGVVNGNTDIYVVDRITRGVVRLTQDASVDDEPAWSPDGTTIAFRSTRSGAGEVWVMNADGSNQRKLTGPAEGWVIDENSFNPAWSPDSRNVVYVKRKGTDADLWIMNADGTAKHQLTSGVAADLEPAWSPDGSRITFQRRSGQSVVLATVLAETGESVVYDVQPSFGATPSHSPDGRWLAYTATDDQRLGALMVLPGQRDNGPRLVRSIETGGGSNAMWIRRP